MNLANLIDDSYAVLRKLQLNFFHISLKFLVVVSRWVFETPSYQDIWELVHNLLHFRYKGVFL